MPLGEHEERVATVRADVAAYAPRLVLGIAWTLAPWWLLFPFLRLGVLGWVVVGIVACGGVLYLANLRAQWFGTALVVTSERVIDVVQRGMGREETMAFPWQEVVDIQAVTRFPFGAVRLVLRNGPFDVRIDGVRDPLAVKKMLHEVQCLHRSPKPARAA